MDRSHCTGRLPCDLFSASVIIQPTLLLDGCEVYFIASPYFPTLSLSPSHIDAQERNETRARVTTHVHTCGCAAGQVNAARSKHYCWLTATSLVKLGIRGRMKVLESMSSWYTLIRRFQPAVSINLKNVERSSHAGLLVDFSFLAGLCFFPIICLRNPALTLKKLDTEITRNCVRP